MSDDRLGRILGPLLRKTVEELGGEWSYVEGRGRVYGLPAMNFIEVARRSLGISIRVWWLGNDVRLSAVLSVPYEANAEALSSSPARIAGLVRALCVGDWSRGDGKVSVDTKLGRLTLDEWPDYPVDMSDPWPSPVDV